MDEKAQLRDCPSSAYHHHLQRPQHGRPQPRRHTLLRCMCVAVCLFLGAWTFRLSPRLHQPISVNDPPGRQTVEADEALTHARHVNNGTGKVSLEAHIMSKCPDAKACLQKLVVPAMEKVNDMVDFQLSFIGSVDPNSDSVACKHGPPECLGNMILLCAAQLYPEPKLSLGFANCMVNDYRDIPQRDLVQSCAMEHGLDFGRINGCISDEGNALLLLRDSVERSADAEIRTSCTIRLQGRTWCVTGGKRDCNDGANLDGLIHRINSTFEHLN